RRRGRAKSNTNQDKTKNTALSRASVVAPFLASSRSWIVVWIGWERWANPPTVREIAASYRTHCEPIFQIHRPLWPNGIANGFGDERPRQCRSRSARPMSLTRLKRKATHPNVYGITSARAPAWADSALLSIRSAEANFSHLKS